MGEPRQVVTIEGTATNYPCILIDGRLPREDDWSPTTGWPPSRSDEVPLPVPPRERTDRAWRRAQRRKD